MTTPMNPMDHPDDAPPSKELKDIALRSAGRAAKAERENQDLLQQVDDLTLSVGGLREDMALAVRRDEYSKGQRDMWASVIAPFVVSAVALAIMAWGIFTLHGLANSNHSVLQSQIPGLQHQLADEREKNAELNDVNNQAVAAIIQMANQIKALGGEPPQIVLKPHVPTTTTTTTTAPPKKKT